MSLETKPVQKKIEVAQIELAMQDKSKLVVVQTAPSVRVALGELFGRPIGEDVTGKMVTSLKRLGFHAVFDTDLGADITIWEEAMEFLDKLKNNKPLPMFTSCCSGWLLQAQNQYADLMPQVSTSKSPVGMLGSFVKTYYAQKINFDPHNILVVSVVPCLLKAKEAQLPFNKTNGMNDVDYSITTKDLANMIMDHNIDFNTLEDSDFDNPLGESTGGGVIFGRSGGVLESCIRTAFYWNDQTIFTDNLTFQVSSLSSDIKEACIKLNGKEYWVAHCGLMGVKKIAQLVRVGLCPYCLVEVMACPGGCIMGAGQPIHLPKEGYTNQEIRTIRAESLNKADINKPVRVSALNSEVQAVYDAIYDGKAGSEKAEENLHRVY